MKSCNTLTEAEFNFNENILNVARINIGARMSILVLELVKFVFMFVLV